MQDMQALAKFSNSDLHSLLVKLRARERHHLVQLLRFLNERDRRMVYAQHGHASLFAYLTQTLKMSKASAARKIAAARLARRFPIIYDKIASSELFMAIMPAMGARRNVR